MIKLAKEKQKYCKEPLNVDEHIALLKSRGLIMKNEERVKYYLENITYYNLSIYFKYYQKDNKFYDGVTFEDVLRIYIFDKKLRFLLLEILERVEKSFKCRMANLLSIQEKDSHWYLNEKIFLKKEDYEDIQTFIEQETEKSREICILHYKDCYNDPWLPPIWMVAEIISFGQSVHIFRSLRREYKNVISRSLNENERFIDNWIYCLSLLRNHCAHHTRLWNRNLTYPPLMNHKVYGEYFNNHSKRLYNYLVMLQIFLNAINPTSSWLEKLRDLIDEYKIDVKQMGFPEDWNAKLSGLITNLDGRGKGE